MFLWLNFLFQRKIVAKIFISEKSTQRKSIKCCWKHIKCHQIIYVGAYLLKRKYMKLKSKKGILLKEMYNKKGGERRKKMKKGLTMLVATVVIFGLISVIGSAAAASYVWVESNVKGVGYKNAEYEVDTRYGIANGIEMQELEAGSGLVTAQKWTLDLDADIDNSGDCCEHLIEKKVLDVEYFPITYQNHSYDSKWLEKKCVKNYYIGAVTDANFIQCEKLQKEETHFTIS